MKKSIRYLVISALVLAAGQSYAKGGSGDGVLLSLNPMMKTQKTELDGTAVLDMKSTLMDINLGYQMSNGLYLGALYVTDSGEISTLKSTVTGLGVSVGYMKSGWFVHGHYILSSEFDQDTSTADKWKKGTGIQTDLGYMAPISGVFYLGIQLTYRALEYKTFESSGVDITTSTYKLTDMTPKLRLTFIF